MRLLRDPKYLLLAMAASLLIACLVGRRSDEFACKTADDCDADRGCFQGFCVVPVCPAGCSSCQDMLPDRSGYAECVIDCAGNECRNSTIECPAGMGCTVQCDNNDDCRLVDCSEASSCKITCSGPSACDEVTCGSGPCSVTCSGTNSCTGSVACGSSCRCDVTCGGTNACGTGATCPAGLGCDSGLGCTSLPGGACNSCP
jgi:hypothetical protein